MAIENTARSWLWQFGQAKEFDKKKSTKDVHYAACAHFAARNKKQLVKTNMDELSMISASCHHVHGDKQWDPYWDHTTRRWVYPGSQEAE